jgi:starch phosphorylase
VLFVPNYSVSVAERLIPAADLSEQISTAGTEASGTGNMKLALNGALTIGTFDGANVEIARAVGKDNIFLFGLFADEAVNLHAHGYEPRARYFADAELRNAIDAIANGVFSPDDHSRFRPITDGLLHHDRYLVLADYAAYMASQGLAEAVYRDVEEWSRRAILNVAHMGALSSDRAISEYAGQIWGVAPAPRAATLAAAE